MVENLFQMAIEYNGMIFKRTEAMDIGDCPKCALRNTTICNQFAQGKGPAAICRVGVPEDMYAIFEEAQ